MPYGPPLYDIFWGNIFCKYGGWGWSELFSITYIKSELIFGKGMRTATFQFSESGDSVNGLNLFTELPFL